MSMTMAERSLPLSQTRSITRVCGGAVEHIDDDIVTEFALTIFVNGKEMATVVCSPEYLEDMTVGFLASEGVIRSAGQIRDLRISTRYGTASVWTTNPVEFDQAFYTKRYFGSCCGKSRQSFYFHNDAFLAHPVTDDNVRLSHVQVLQLMKQMEEGADLFSETGGVHRAGMFDGEGAICFRDDIGRHNALDKLYGYGLQRDLVFADTTVIFSGRLSSEVILKVAKMGVPVIIAKSAPTALALDIAAEMRITAVGFARADAFNIYTRPERILH